jgi:hypothetical protein
VGTHAVKKATRFEALEPIHQAVKEYFRDFSAGAADGLRLRHDHGSVYMSEDFQNEIKFLGIEVIIIMVKFWNGSSYRPIHSHYGGTDVTERMANE